MRQRTHLGLINKTKFSAFTLGPILFILYRAAVSNRREMQTTKASCIKVREKKQVECILLNSIYPKY
jgi:hypothetical protein